jgi:hypothetical protein
MSFDLYIFLPSGPQTVEQARRLLDEEERRIVEGDDSPLPPPGPEMARFLGELERRWPSLDEDPDGSLWSSWPLWQPLLGGGTSLNIRWSQAKAMRAAILDIAESANVVVYDRQSDEVISPSRRLS